MRYVEKAPNRIEAGVPNDNKRNFAKKDSVKCLKLWIEETMVKKQKLKKSLKEKTSVPVSLLTANK